MTNCIAMVVHPPSSVEQEERIYRNKQDFVCPPQKVRGRQKCPRCPGAAWGGCGGARPCEPTLWGWPVSD